MRRGWRTRDSVGGRPLPPWARRALKAGGRPAPREAPGATPLGRPRPRPRPARPWPRPRPAPGPGRADSERTRPGVCIQRRLRTRRPWVSSSLRSAEGPRAQPRRRPAAVRERDRSLGGPGRAQRGPAQGGGRAAGPERTRAPRTELRPRGPFGSAREVEKQAWGPSGLARFPRAVSFRAPAGLTLRGLADLGAVARPRMARVARSTEDGSALSVQQTASAVSWDFYGNVPRCAV